MGEGSRRLNVCEVHIRKARPSDVVGLASCLDAAYARYVDRVQDMPSVSEGCVEDIAQNQVWVATDDGKIIGGLFLIAEPGFMKLANLAVHPESGGRGVGGKLMALAEGQAVEQGYHEMRLNTHVAMPENVELYSHLGWQQLQTSGNTITMRKGL